MCEKSIVLVDLCNKPYIIIYHETQGHKARFTEYYPYEENKQNLLP